MPQRFTGHPLRGNALLGAFTDAQMQSLLPHLELLPLHKDQVIFHPNERNDYVWFPRTGMISIVIDEDDGDSSEVATVGREGMTGLAPVLGSDTSIFSAVVQMPGEGWRLGLTRFCALIDEHPDVKQLLLRYVLAAMTQMGRNVVCAQSHDIVARCARWMLLAHDDIDGNTYSLTQEYLARILGVTRPSVSAAASMLKQAGLIRYVRGEVTITNRVGLEAAACDCYRAMTREFDRLRAM